MSIRDEARQEAERRWPSYPSVGFSGANDRQQAFIDGAIWAFGQAAPQERAVCDQGCTAVTGLCIVDHKPTTASEQSDREPSDAEVEAVADAVEAASAQWEFEFDQYRAGSRAYADPGPKAEYLARAALLAAREVRDVS